MCIRPFVQLCWNLSSYIGICIMLFPGEYVQLRWNMSNYFEACPAAFDYVSCYSMGTTDKSVQLGWNLSNCVGILFEMNLSNCVGICQNTLEYYSRWICPTALESVQLRWNTIRILQSHPPKNKNFLTYRTAIAKLVAVKNPWFCMFLHCFCMILHQN